MASAMGTTSGAARGSLVDLDALLAPIPGEAPEGANLSFAGLHNEIREARRADDRLDQGDWKRELKLSDWVLVERLATQALAHQTKDLQVCAWLAEALVKLYGWAGLHDGLRAMRGLLERFWPGCYPPAEDGDNEARANVLTWMDRQLSLAVSELPLTGSSLTANYNYHDYEGAARFDIPDDDKTKENDKARVNQLKELAAREGHVTTADWRKAKNTTGRAFYEELYALLVPCLKEFEALDRVVDERFGAQTPGLNTLKRTLEGVGHLVETVVREKRMLEPAPPQAEAVAPPPTTAEADTDTAEDAHAAQPSTLPDAKALAGGARQKIETREMALARLAEIADYLRRTEPHSPVSYLVQRAVRWGQMPLDAWLKEVIKDGGVLGSVRETLGIKDSPGGDGE